LYTELNLYFLVLLEKVIICSHGKGGHVVRQEIFLRLCL